MSDIDIQEYPIHRNCFNFRFCFKKGHRDYIPLKRENFFIYSSGGIRNFIV